MKQRPKRQPSCRKIAQDLVFIAIVYSCHAIGSVSAQQELGQNDEIFEFCNINDYYQRFEGGPDPSFWTKAQVHGHLMRTHENVLPYTSSTREDVWDALIDLDASPDTPDSVHLIYRDTDVPAFEYGTAPTWNREHLWPRSRGVGDSGPDNTDIHALRPSDWNVNAARSNLFFGDCESECTSRPATPEAAPDTAKDGQVFLPPVDVRGDIARALMYMAVRYGIADDISTTTILELTDCPDASSDNRKQMAFLSELLQWHWEDPPDENEFERNNRACARWQGNRNVFVDYPELATVFFGVPSSKPYDCSAILTPPPSSETTTSPTQEPTAASTVSPPAPTTTPPTPSPEDGSPNNDMCSELSAGDVQIVAFNSDNPDSVALAALEDLPEGLELYMTDNAWTGDGFRSNEGTVMLRVPTGGISQGEVFGYGADDSNLGLADDWVPTGSSAFALATAGESLIIYCISSGNNAIVPLGAFTTGQWEEAFLDSYSTNESALPTSLRLVGSVQTNSDFDNYVYDGLRVGTKARLLQEIGDESNWIGSNSERQDFVGQFFSVLADDDGMSSITPKSDPPSQTTRGPSPAPAESSSTFAPAGEDTTSEDDDIVSSASSLLPRITTASALNLIFILTVTTVGNCYYF